MLPVFERPPEFGMGLNDENENMIREEQELVHVSGAWGMDILEIRTNQVFDIKQTSCCATREYRLGSRRGRCVHCLANLEANETVYVNVQLPVRMCRREGGWRGSGDLILAEFRLSRANNAGCEVGLCGKR